jgi:amino acid adenylation domain-containing protein
MGGSQGTDGIAARFLEAAAASPDAIALSSPSEDWSYTKLLRRSGGVAIALGDLGVGPGDRVGIASGRGFGRIVGMLGTALAGAAFVPIDPKQPRSRISEIVADAEIEVVLQGARGGSLEMPVSVLDLDQAGEAAAPPDHSPGDVDRLAYVIFTSGSSGRPKGVEIVDRGVLALVEAVDELARRHRVDRILQFAAHTFDASIWEIFPALLTGRSLWFPVGEPGTIEPEQLLGEAMRAGVEMVTLPPSYLIAADPATVTAMPKLTVVAGEPCPPALVRRWASRTALHNAYGPTEITVAATISQLTEDDAEEVPIGHPLPHVDIGVLSEGAPVEDASVGELFLGGPSLARGYLGDPRQTAERFRELDTKTGRQRMYATGDLVRRRSDGQLVFVERADRQVKVRGYRVELGDVEAALLADPAVEQAAVIATGREELLDRLIAFVSGPKAEPAAVRAEIARRRPDYMVPAEVRVITTWPTNSSGKIDHSALRASIEETEEAAPSTSGSDLADELARHWRDLLEVSQIGPDANFFDLGGHSILVIRLVGAVRDGIGVKITTRDLYEHPRFDEFCAVVEAKVNAVPDPA